MPLTADQQSRTKILFAEVEATVEANGTIVLSQHDTARRFVRFLDTQKRAIGMNLTTFVLTASIAILGGPITAAIGLGAAIIGFGLSTAWERFSVHRAKGKYAAKAAARGAKPDAHGVVRIKPMDEHGAMREDYAEVLTDLTTILKKQGLTDVYNALANMDTDFQHLGKFVADPHITGGWTLPSDAPGHKLGASRETPVLKGQAAPAEAPPIITLNSCNDAVEFWETTARVNKRFTQVAETIYMLDDFVMHIALAVSRYDATERRDLRYAWQMIGSNRTPAQIYDAFNTAIRTDAIQKYVGRHMYTKEYSGWVFSVIPDFIKDSWTPGFRLDMQLEMLKRNDKDAFAKAKAAVEAAVQKAIADKAAEASTKPGVVSSSVSGLMSSAKGYVGSVVPIPDDLNGEEVGGIIKSISVGMGSAFLSTWLNSLKSDSWQYAHTAASAADPDSLASVSGDTAVGYFDPLNPTTLVHKAGKDAAYNAQVASHIMGAVTAVVNVAIEAINKMWNERKLRTGQTLGLTGMRQQSFGERIGTLRTFAKEEIQGYVELMDDWEKAHTKLSGSLDDRTVFGAFLMHLKAVQDYYGNHTGQFFEELVFMANEMSLRVQRTAVHGSEVIAQWVAKDKSAHITSCKGKRFCYASAADIFWSWAVNDVRLSQMPLEMEHQIKMKFDAVPARMLAGNSTDDIIASMPEEVLAPLMGFPLP